MQNLDRYWSAENGVSTLPNLSHAAGGNWSDEFVAFAEQRPDPKAVTEVLATDI